MKRNHNKKQWKKMEISKNHDEEAATNKNNEKKDEDTNEVLLDEILKVLNITSPSKVEKSLLSISLNKSESKINNIKYAIDTCFLVRLCEALSSFPKERLIPSEFELESDTNNERSTIESVTVAGEVSVNKEGVEKDSASTSSGLETDEKKRANFENSDVDTLVQEDNNNDKEPSKINEGKLIGLVSGIVGVLAKLSKYEKEEIVMLGLARTSDDDTANTLQVTVSDVVDRCTKNISCDSTRKVILDSIGAEMACFGLSESDENGGKRLTRMLAKALLAILSKVQLMHNLYEKFDGIWKGFSGFDKDSVVDLDTARQIAWTIQSVLSVDRFAGADYSISLMAASSYMVAQLCDVLTDNNHNSSNDESQKASKQQATNSLDNNDAKEKMFNLSIEEEAISALSMMPTSGSPPHMQKDNHQDLRSQHFLQVIATHTHLTMDDIQPNLLLISDVCYTNLSATPNANLDITHLTKNNQSNTIDNDVEDSTSPSKKRKRTDEDNNNMSEALPPHLRQLFTFFNTKEECVNTCKRLKNLYHDLCSNLCVSLLTSTENTNDDNSHRLLCDETQDFFHSLALLMVDEVQLINNEDFLHHLSTATATLPLLSPCDADAPSSSITYLKNETSASFVDDNVKDKQQSRQQQQKKTMSLPQASTIRYNNNSSIDVVVAPGNEQQQQPSPITLDDNGTTITTDTNLSFDPSSAFSNSFFNKIDDFNSHMSLPNITHKTPIMDSISLVDWISRLCDDYTLAKPSMILLSYFHTADSMSLPLLRQSQDNSTLSIWNDVVTLLNFTFTKLVKSFHYEKFNDDNKQFPHMTPEVLPSGEISFQHTFSPYHHQQNQQQQPAYNSPFGLSSDNGQHQKKVLSSLLALYYYSLESILTKESVRLQSLSHGKLLNNFGFHRSLLAACIECILKSLSCNSINFTNVLSLMDVDPYEFLKVSEGFVRALTFPIQDAGGSWRQETAPPPIGLPETLRNHLQQREEQILDSLLWIYKQENTVTNTYAGGMIAAIADMQQEQDPDGEQHLQSHWPPPSFLDNSEGLDLHVTVIVEESKSVISKNNDKDASSFRPWPSNSKSRAYCDEKCGQRHIAASFVFRKLIKLTARRVHKLSQKLCLIDPVIDVIWRAWKYFLRTNIHLLYNRHIDQLILCTIYGVCRVIKVVPEVSFVRIIDCYQMANPGREKLNNKITRKVRIRTIDNTKDDFGNVITLYNQIYVPVMKSFLLENQKFDFLKMQEQKVKQEVKTVEDAAMIADRAASTASILHELGARKKNSVSISPSSLSSPGFDDSSPLRIPNSKIFVTTTSPSTGYRCGRLAAMRKNFAMPRTRAIYNFGDSSSKDLSLINKTIRVGLSGTSSNVSHF